MKFSVVIPAYNREHELSRCIESVLEQTYKNFELIIIDNGSTDNTHQVVKEYIEQDSRVKYYWQENTGSPAGSRNTGISKAHGEWIAFLDSDDYWYKEKLNKVLDIIESNNDVIAVSHYEDKFVDGVFESVLKHGDRLKKENTYNALLFEGNNLSTSAMTVRKDKLLEAGMFDPRKDYFAVEDYDLWLKLAQLGRFAYIKEPLGVFVIAKSNMSGNVELINNNLRTLVLNHIDKLQVSNKDRLKKKHAARIVYYKGRTYQMNGDFIKAIPVLFKSIIEYPYSIKKYISLGFSLLHIKK